jgi:hypothetical protein
MITFFVGDMSRRLSNYFFYVQGYRWTQIVNPSDGRSGQVIMFWKKEKVIQRLFSTLKYIDARVEESLGKNLEIN